MNFKAFKGEKTLKTPAQNGAFRALNLAFNALFFASCVAYPFFYTRTQMLVLMAILWALRGFLRGEKFAFFVAAFFATLCFLQNDALKMLYPSAMSFMFAGLFLLSLKSEPFITRLARLKTPNLNTKAIKYTRNLSAFWGIFLLANGVFALVLAFFSVKAWQLWCGVGFYAVFGAIFAVEFLARQVLIRKNNE